MNKIIPFERSFAAHPKSQYWNYERNIGKPSDYALNSHKKFWFDCNKCGHCFDSSCLNINQANNWCPYCSLHPIKLCGDDTCIPCFENSFASHPKSQFWSNKNILQPRQLFISCDRQKFVFNCLCGHEILIILKQISSQGQWCSYCSHQKLCDNKECIMCFNNSFASIERSKYLHDKNINPRTLFKSTNKIFEFDCDLCNKVFKSQLSGVTKGVWCSFCVNKTEQILFVRLKETYNALKQQFRVDWCKNLLTNRYLPFDFVIEDKKIIIELDGKQHFEQIGKWLSPEKNRKNDLYKMNCANKNGFSVIRILQKDVYYDKYDWLNELINNIENNTIDNRVQNLYMCKNNEYKDFDN